MADFATMAATVANMVGADIQTVVTNPTIVSGALGAGVYKGYQKYRG